MWQKSFFSAKMNVMQSDMNNDASASLRVATNALRKCAK